ncbi:hypothetical protein RCO27_09560 [Sphingosinicella sp. LHD-64]|uniref:hypothetical protein n=1 Tax=Sphingosinicella sp. LHD-64 TaxID=3072139 RepID=UPI00280EA0F3|nr:hypothetical protein [Sphingosinicella sp. LHD-64]MDQ8756476.1 hypothetical protein [Sphingosinicella sp. LHD-64]
MRPAFLFLLAPAIVATPASAQETSQERPEALMRVLACRALQSSEERLACYDREVGAFEAAESSNQLVVMDREQVRRTRRTLFGLALPDLGVFGDNNQDPQEAVAEIQTTIRSAAQNPLGKWIIVLEDGARWIQTDVRELAREPRGGMPIRIRRAAMGSYLANIDNQVAVRVRRER